MDLWVDLFWRRAPRSIILCTIRLRLCLYVVERNRLYGWLRTVGGTETTVKPPKEQDTSTGPVGRLRARDADGGMFKPVATQKSDTARVTDSYLPIGGKPEIYMRDMTEKKKKKRYLRGCAYN